MGPLRGMASGTARRTAGARVVGMTLAVYKIAPDGRKTEIRRMRTVHPDKAPIMSSAWPPCTCPTCRTKPKSTEET
jgi:hypothetical protein